MALASRNCLPFLRSMCVYSSRSFTHTSMRRSWVTSAPCNDRRFEGEARFTEAIRVVSREALVSGFGKTNLVHYRVPFRHCPIAIPADAGLGLAAAILCGSARLDQPNRQVNLNGRYPRAAPRGCRH
jgi:hypothetical protein